MYIKNFKNGNIFDIILSVKFQKKLYFGKTRFDFGSAVCVRLRRQSFTLELYCIGSCYFVSSKWLDRFKFSFHLTISFKMV